MNKEIPRVMRDAYIASGPVALTNQLLEFVTAIAEVELIKNPEITNVLIEDDLVSEKEALDLQKQLADMKQHILSNHDEIREMNDMTCYLLRKDNFVGSLQLPHALSPEPEGLSLILQHDEDKSSIDIDITFTGNAYEFAAFFDGYDRELGDIFNNGEIFHMSRRVHELASTMVLLFLAFPNQRK